MACPSRIGRARAECHDERLSGGRKTGPGGGPDLSAPDHTIERIDYGSDALSRSEKRQSVERAGLGRAIDHLRMDRIPSRSEGRLWGEIDGGELRGPIAGDSAIESDAALADGGANSEAETSRLDEARQCETDLNADCAAPVTQEDPEEAADRGAAEEVAENSGEGQTSEKAPTEPNFCDDVCIAQHQETIDVPANSGGFPGLDNLQTKPSMRGRLSSEAVQILWSGVPAHPLRRRLQSIWLSSDLATDVRFVQPATHPLSLRLREIALPRYRQYSSVDRRNVIRSTIYSGSTVGSVVAIKPESKGRHHSISRQPAKKPLSGFVSGSSAGRHAHRAFARQVARFLTDSAFG
jgi:hypothetical protein